MIRSLLLLLALYASPLLAEPIADQKCQECHGQKGFSADHAGGKQALHVNDDLLKKSVHGKQGCVDCHQDIKELPHKKDGLEKVDCIGCHETVYRDKKPVKGRSGSWIIPDLRIIKFTKEYQLSAHKDRSKPGNADCATCHTGHYVFPSRNPLSSTYRMTSPELCGACHPDELREYKTSLHATGLKRPWLGKSATCVDCHTAHQVSDMKQQPAHHLVSQNCGNCHEEELRGYMASPHGQLAWHGNNDAPRCDDCHGSHKIGPVDGTGSPVASGKLLETCQKCHKDATPEFTKYHPHGTISNFEKYPALWIFGRGMAALVIAVLLFFYVHSVLWFIREWKERPVTLKHAGYYSVPVRAEAKHYHSAKHFRRFSWGWRLNHWLLALSLMTLVFTGMAVMYPNTGWAMWLVPRMGGTDVFNIIHRVSGVLFLLTVFGHALVALVRISRDKHFEWFGPNSLLPRKKDWEDMKGQFKWYFGKGKQPRFDRWTYWEKFDYWAVYWGALVIGVSGLMLWFAEDVARFLPGWIFNLATIAHGMEAFLAVMTLFVVHFFNNHFRPVKFPLDTVMFTGSWDLGEFKEERPEEYERLVASGELEKYLVDPPSKRWNLVSHILGFTLLGIGLVLLVMVVDGYLTRGLFG